MTKSNVVRDERTVVVENQSYRWGYFVLAFGLLLVIAYRAYALGETSWELFALILLSGLVTTLYQQMNQILTHHWVRVALASAMIAAGIAVAIAFLR